MPGWMRMVVLMLVRLCVACCGNGGRYSAGRYGAAMHLVAVRSNAAVGLIWLGLV